MLILSIKKTIAKHCQIELSVSNVIFYVENSLLLQVPVSINVTSHLQVPSFIIFQNSDIRGSDINLQLCNPYVVIDNCTFDHVSVQIVSMQHYFEQDLYFVKIMESHFTKANRDGNGGALFVRSDVLGSILQLSVVSFVSNRALRSSNLDGGKGGAIYAEGTSLYATLENCLFINNTASEDASALFISQGVSVLIRNSSFTSEMDRSVWQPIFSIYGQAKISFCKVQLRNDFPDFNIMDLTIFRIEQFVDENSFISVFCPLWYKHVSEYRTTYGSPERTNETTFQIYNFRHKCGICTEGFYTPSIQHNMISYNASGNTMHETPEAMEGCSRCPYGAQCTGNNVLPHPNYWGYWHDGRLVFQQCPVGFCCSGADTAPCTSFDLCAGKRTGILCGSCQEGFSVSILTGECTSDNSCGGDQWFWLLVPFATLAYAMWYTCKDDVFRLIFRCLKQSMQSFKKDDVSAASNSSSADSKTNTSSNDDAINKVEVDKGYFGIVTYFVQMAAVIKIPIEFNDFDNRESFLDKLLNNIETFLNIDLRQLSFDACPIVGLTTAGKQAYRFMFLVGIYISWAVVFLLIIIALKWLQKGNILGTMTRRFQSFKLLLVRSFVEIIKYTYSGFCSIIFMSLICVNIGNKYVWWYDGSNICFEKWQILIIMFGIFYAVPFPLTLFLSMRWLKTKKISTLAFLCCSLCPFFTVCFFFKENGKKKAITNPLAKKYSKESVVILSVLQGPYREEGNKVTIYWEAVISFRRFLISIMSLISNASIRMMIIATISVLFFGQHIFFLPFKAKASNYAEAFSLLLLVLTSIINLFKASLTDSGVVPSGPSVPFFKGLEMCEKLFIFFLIAYILAFEFRNKQRSHSFHAYR